MLSTNNLTPCYEKSRRCQPTLPALESARVLAFRPVDTSLCELITPTNGALMAILASAGVRYEAWLRHVLPLYLGLVALGLVAIAVAVGL